MTAYIKKWNIYYATHWYYQEYKITINQKYIVEAINDYIHLYKISWELKKVIFSAIKDFYKNITDQITKKNKALESQKQELKKRESRIFELLCDEIINNEKYKTEKNEITLKLLNIDSEIKEYSDSELIIYDEALQVVELLSNIDVERKNADYEKKLKIIQTVFVELKIDTKKQLYIQENELFEIIKIFNSSEWFGIQENCRTNLQRFCEYIFKNKKIIKEILIYLH